MPATRGLPVAVSLATCWLEYVEESRKTDERKHVE